MNILYGYELSILQGTLLTLELSILSLLISMILGLLGALGKLSGSKALYRLINAYTTIIRGIPELVLMLLFYYGGQVFINWLAESVGYEEYIDISPFIAGVATISFIYGAYMTETFRGAFMAVPGGQLEAGVSFGMNKIQVFSRILFPQMLKFALPGFGNNWLVMVKATALVSIIGLDDMVRKASLAAGSTNKPFTFYIAIAFIYLLITTVSNKGLAALEKRSNRGERKE